MPSRKRVSSRKVLQMKFTLVAVCRVALAVLSGVSAGCAIPGSAAKPAVQPRSPITVQGLPSGVESDTALFAVVLRAIPPPRAQRKIRVEPRPVRPSPSAGSVHLEDLISDEGLVRDRAAVLERLGIERFDFDESSIRRWKTGPGGLVPRRQPGDPPHPREEAERVMCVIVALPRPGGVFYPPLQIDTRGTDNRVWTTRVFTMDPSAYVVRDVVARRDPATGEWEVIEVQELKRIMS